MPVKDIYGSKVNKETHLRFSYNPTSELLKQIKMGDGRTDLFRNMWTRTTTNDTKGASLEEQARHTDWEYSDTEVREQQNLDIEYMPDQRMHRIVSFVKSGFRIVGAFTGMFGYVPAAFGLFFLAEVVGIYEELV